MGQSSFNQSAADRGAPLQYPRRQKQLQALLDKLGVPAQSPIQWSLLDLALTHPTASTTDNYEQLEFVGDAVVRLAAAEFLLETYPQAPVGDFTAIRSVLVSDRVLAQLADRHGFDRYLLVDNSAAADEAGRQSRLADAFEAVLGALYLSSQQIASLRVWLDPLFRPLAEEILADPARHNYKAALQERTQARYRALPEYRVEETESRKSDDERFVAAVWFRGQQLGSGQGRTIKAAEQAAAKVALCQIEQGLPF